MKPRNVVAMEEFNKLADQYRQAEAAFADDDDAEMLSRIGHSIRSGCLLRCIQLQKEVK